MTDEVYWEPTATTDIGAEQVVLGSIMLDATTMDELIEVLHADDFAESSHFAIYSTLIDRYVADQPMDANSVAADLLGNPRLRALGGAALYLHTLIQRVPTVAMTRSYAEVVLEKSRRRRLASTGLKINAMANDVGVPIDEAISRAGNIVDGMEESAAPGSRHITDYVAELLASIGSEKEQRRFGYGLADLDRLMGPIKPGHLITFAGRPGMGKSLALLQVARRNAFADDKVVLSFSLEMTGAEWSQRVLSAQTGVAWKDVEEGRVTRDGIEKIRAFQDNYSKSAYHVVHRPSMTIAQILGQARRYKRIHKKIDVVTVDYLQLVTPTKGSNRQEEISEMMRSLKIGATELECGMVVAAQLNRGPEGRADKRPLLSDLRESGAIEQDSDAVILLYRADYYDPNENPGEVEFIGAKNRHGATGTVVAASQLPYSRFRNMSTVQGRS